MRRALSQRLFERRLDFLKRLGADSHTDKLRVQIARFVAGLRKLDLRKAPSIAETLDWARGLCALGVRELDPTVVRQTLALVVKHEEDLRKAEGKVTAILGASGAH